MKQQFLQELEHLLHSNPYTHVDILPLVLRLTEGMHAEQISVARMGMRNILTQLQNAGDIQVDSEVHRLLSTRIANEYQPGAMYISGTIQFERRIAQNEAVINKTFPDSSIHIVADNATVTAGQHNSVSVSGVKTSTSSQTSPAAGHSKPKGVRYWLIENPLTTALLGGLLALIIGTIILVKLGYLH